MALQSQVEAPFAPNDASVFSRLRSGDRLAFEALVRSQAPRLLAVSRRLLGDEREAREVVQEAFLGALESVDYFQGSFQVSTWLHRIVVKAALKKLHARRPKAEEPIDALLPTFLEDGHHTLQPPAWRRSAMAAVQAPETRDFVRACIDGLPESHRTVLILRDIEELDGPETAWLLGLTENVVKLRLHRARQALRSLLEPRFRDAEAEA